MRERDYYPAGAYNDPSAPFNEPVIPERDFDISVQYVLEKTAVVTTDKYQPEYDEESGHTYADTTYTDWEDAYKDSGHHTIPEMLDELKKYIEQELATSELTISRKSLLKEMLEDCQEWELIESDYSET